MISKESLISQGCVMHFTGNASNGFNILPAGVTVTPNGTFTTSIRGKDGRNYLKFDGDTNHVSLSDNDAWNFGSGDFTICGWLNIHRNTRGFAFVRQVYDGSNYWVAYWDESMNKLVYTKAVSGTDTGTYMTSFTPTLNSWYHVVISKSGSSCLMYINGIFQTVSSLNTWSGTFDFNIVLQIGAGSMGYIKDLMIFKGKALTQDQIAALMAETYIY